MKENKKRMEGKEKDGKNRDKDANGSNRRVGGLTSMEKCELGAKGKERSDNAHMLWFEHYIK